MTPEVAQLVARVEALRDAQPHRLRPNPPLPFAPALLPTARPRFLGAHPTADDAQAAIDAHRPAYVEPWGGWFLAFALEGNR